MLGIRHYKGRAVDLWQGPSEDFCSDLMVRLVIGASESIKAPSESHEGVQQFMEERFQNFAEFNQMELQKWFKLADQKNFRHICFEWVMSEDHCHAQNIRDFYQKVHDFLDEETPQTGSVRRITSILNRPHDYEVFRDEMMRVFPGTETK